MIVTFSARLKVVKTLGAIIQLLFHIKHFLNLLSLIILVFDSFPYLFHSDSC